MGEKAGNYLNKIITPERAAELRQEGWKWADLHVHTSCSFDVLPAPALHPKVLYEKGLELGMDFITFTDHDTMEAYEILGWDRERLVPGVELTVYDQERVGHTVHMNVYELDREKFEELRELSEREKALESVISYLKKHRLPYMYNHPFWFEFHEVANPEGVPDLAEHFPVLEYNMHELKLKNEMVITLAERLGKGIAATTDAHTGKLGKAYTLAKGDSFREFFRNIEMGENFIIPEDLTREILIEEMNTWIDLIFEKCSQAQEINENREIMENQEIKVFLTGIKSVDTVVRISRSNLLHCFPKLNRKTMELCYLISRTGLPASFYIYSEESLAKHIARQMKWKEK